MTKLPTINLKGHEYVLVKDRVAEFHRAYPNGSIQTEVKFVTNSYACFKATVTPDCFAVYKHAMTESLGSLRIFVGHSSGEVSEEKSLEHLETTAVGRALAFANIGIIESIASADEIVKFENKRPKSGLRPCDKCNSEFILKDGINGKFYACSGYPGCRRTIALEEADMWKL